VGNVEAGGFDVEGFVVPGVGIREKPRIGIRVD
jgi:hypothetical protein